jgi:hypothetical protein
MGGRRSDTQELLADQAEGPAGHFARSAVIGERIGAENVEQGTAVWNAAACIRRLDAKSSMLKFFWTIVYLSEVDRCFGC